MGKDITHPDAEDETLDKQKFELTLTPTAEDYSLSCWIKVTPFGNKVPFFGIAEFDSAGNQLRKETITTDCDEFEVFRDWLRFETIQRFNPSTRRIELVIDGKNSIVDQFLFKPVKDTVAVLPNINGHVYLNNFFVKIDSLR